MQLIKNNAYSSLAGALTNVATSLTVATGTGDRFPIVTGSDYCMLTLQDASNNIEIIKVTARASASDSMTIARGQEGTTARAWNIGDVVELRITAGTLNPLQVMAGAATAGAIRTSLGSTGTGDALFTAADAAAARTAIGATTTGSAVLTAADAAAARSAIGAVSAADTVANATTAAYGSGIVAGTRMLFQQTSAPTGWTKDTTHNDKALRVVSGTASSGGTVDFSVAFASQTPSGTVGNTTLSTAQMPSHNHSVTGVSNYVGAGGGDFGDAPSGSTVTGSQGGGGSHNHSFTGNAINLTVKYVDIIIATKD